jgi:hypothetical protein
MIMKKVAMTIAGMLFVGTAAVFAQSDSSKSTMPSDQPSRQQPAGQSQYRTSDRITVPADQVPSSLRQTLQGSQYKGWETVPLYQDRTTQEYYFELPDKTGGTTKQLYRFDRNGKAISGSSRSGMKDGAGTSGSGTSGSSSDSPTKP